MTVNQQDREEIAKMISDGKKADSAFVRFQPTWAALAIIGAIFFAGWQAKAFMSTEVKSQIAPLKDEMTMLRQEIAKGFESVYYALNGNPELGVKGMNERLGAIEAKLDK